VGRGHLPPPPPLPAPPRRWRGLYVATCACGWDMYGLSLPTVWKRHQMHLDATRNAAANRHPSRRPRWT